MKLIFIADFFLEHILGGGELNNEELITILNDKGIEIFKHQSHLMTVDFINENRDCKFIIGNFMNLREDCKTLLQSLPYVIYEHDHKYLKTRNPKQYPGFVAPKNEIINYDFYKNARAVLCQSEFHTSIVKNNLNLDNIINLSGNLWTPSSLQQLEAMLSKEKLNKCSILDSPIPHKNTRQAVRFCEFKKKEYELISSSNHEDFLEKISNNKTFVFFPKTPETLSRVVVEVRMMGMSVITNELVGAALEPWYDKKGLDLIKEVNMMRDRIPNQILEVFDEKSL